MGRRANRHCAKQIGRASAHAVLMRSAKNCWSKLRVIANVERADARRRAQLVAAEGHQIASKRIHAYWNPANCLRRIDVKQRAGLFACRRKWREFLDRSDFRVRKSERDECGLAIE